MDSINLTEIPAILSYGAIGLAFLMMGLGYLLLRKVVTQPNPSSGTQTTCRWFLLIALLSLIAGGLLAVYRDKRPINVTLVLSPQVIAGVSPPRVVLDMTDVHLQDGMGRLKVVDGNSLVFRLDSLADKIRDLQQMLAIQAGQQAKVSHEVGASNEF